MESNRNCEIFRDFYHHLFERINFEYHEETGEHIKPYKEYEPDLLIQFCLRYENEQIIKDQLAKLLSGLITLQSLPNANHRTAFRFVDLYLGFSCREKLRIYSDAQDLYDKFYDKSKSIIDFEINHGELFNENYMDAHHKMGIQNHFMYSKELIEKITETQSGIMEAVPFQRFITSLYQEGSTSNQTGSF